MITEDADPKMPIDPAPLERGTRSPGADLTLDPPIVITGGGDNITFSKEKPNEGDSVHINSTVTNNGDEAANATVEFYDGHPDEGDLIGSDSVFVEPGISITVSALWDTTGEEQEHIIYVVVDPDNTVDETNEDNNVVLRDILVNQRPVAVVYVEDYIAFVDYPLFLSSYGSSDPDSNWSSLNYTWDLGDGTIKYGTWITHMYSFIGEYTVSLKVTDDNLAFDFDRIFITVRHRPKCMLVRVNLEFSECKPGQTMEVSGGLEFEFSPELLNIDIPQVDIEIIIPESGGRWYTKSDENGNYKVDITAPNATGTYTVQVEGIYNVPSSTGFKRFRVTEAEPISYFSVQFVFLYVTLAAILGVGLIYGGSELGRYRLLLLIFIPLYTHIKKDKVLDHFHRGRLYNYIEDHPGVTFSELKKKFAFKNGNLVYHLNFLERMEFLRSKKEGRHRRFYIKGDFSKSEDLSIYINEIQKRILSVIERSPGITQSKIAAIMGTSRQKISYNINALEYAGIIRSIREGSRKIRYYPVSVESG